MNRIAIDGALLVKDTPLSREAAIRGAGGRSSYFSAFTKDCKHLYIDSCTDECFNHATIEARLYYVPLDSGGYDGGGAYWGYSSLSNQHLYFAEAKGFFCSVRATSREEAATEIRNIVAKYKGKVNFRGIPKA